MPRTPRLAGSFGVRVANMVSGLQALVRAPAATARLRRLVTAGPGGPAPPPPRLSGTHKNSPPPLTWSNVPDVKAWALVVEDPDAPQEEPFIHWMIWNIPPDTLRLPEGLPNDGKLM